MEFTEHLVAPYTFTVRLLPAMIHIKLQNQISSELFRKFYTIFHFPLENISSQRITDIKATCREFH
jgi:hypothetical protein